MFGEQPARFAQGRSFLVSNLSNLLTLLIFGEQPERFAHIAHWKRGNERIARFFLTYKKCTKNTILVQKILSESLIFHEQPEQIALLTWAIWAIRSQLLICPEWIAHSRSFDLSDLSEWENSQPCIFELVKPWLLPVYRGYISYHPWAWWSHGCSQCIEDIYLTILEFDEAMAAPSV